MTLNYFLNTLNFLFYLSSQLNYFTRIIYIIDSRRQNKLAKYNNQTFVASLLYFINNYLLIFIIILK